MGGFNIPWKALRSIRRITKWHNFPATLAICRTYVFHFFFYSAIIPIHVCMARPAVPAGLAK